jgi:small-conductance mechanosensitive channel
MVLFIECIIACLIFGAGIVGSVLKNKEFWLQEYAPAVQERFLSLHPEYKPSSKKESMATLIIKKIIACVLFIVLLTFMVYIAGARDFAKGFSYCYIIWFVVNLFDVIVLDIGILAHWKKCRLPGTEDMDKEYRSNYKKSIIDGFAGMAIGAVVALVVGFIIMLIF